MNCKKTLDLAKSTLKFLSVGSLYLFAFAIVSFSQNKPFDQFQIQRALLTRGLTPETLTFEARLKFITENVRRNGVDFELTEEIESHIRDIGAGDELINAIKRAPRRKPLVSEESETAEGYFLRGYLCPQKDYACRMINFTKAIMLNPKFVDAYNERGAIYSQQTQQDEAIADFSKAIQHGPNYARPYINRAISYANQNNQSLALRDFNFALSINPKFAGVYYSRGNMYLRQNSIQSAIENFDEAIQLNPKFYTAHGQRGIAYFMLMNYQKAVEDFTKVLELHPNDILAYENRAIVYEKLGDKAKAQADRMMVKKLTNQ